MQWTTNQKNAIDAKGSSVIVSAAAGSGKTAVLTERLINLIADPDSGVRADRMIIVTFTNDAASELKKRLDRKIRDLINENPLNSHLAKQQILLQSAKISTINSFCFELIRDNISDQGITSGFGILDETDDKVIKVQAMDELIEYYSKNERDKLSFMYDNFCIRGIRRLTDVISETDKFLSSVAFRNAWLDTAVEEYKKDFTDSIYYSLLIKNCSEKLETAYALAKECSDMAEDMFYGVTDDKQYIKTIEQSSKECKIIKNLYDVFLNNRILNEKEISNIKFDKLVTTGKSDYDKAIREIFKNKRDTYKEIIKEVIQLNDNAEYNYKISAEVTEILSEMVKKYQSIIWDKKCSKNSISFDDGERLALELLATIDNNGCIVQSETALKTAEFYDIIMIDEYQDSNNKQDMIFKLISKNYHIDENGNHIYGNNVFLVGDVKQSIYRFRLANPKNFISTLKHSEKYTLDSDCPNKKIFLNQNFRSSPEVIDFVNYVFGNIMSEKCGDIDYNDDEKLYFGAKAYSGGRDFNRLTHISFINDNSVYDDEQSNTLRKKNIKEKPNLEAIFTARKIFEMIQNGEEVLLENGEKRKCVPSDFCILVRNNDFINKYAEELEKFGIPARTHEDSGYLKSREIAILIDLLRIISNPLLDVSMTAVMTSPMYMFDISEIAFIKSFDREKPLFTVMLGIVNGEYENCDISFVQRCRGFLDSIEGFRLDSITMTIGELIGKIYDTTDFISVMQLYNDGEKKRANLRTLIQHAKNYEKLSSVEGLSGLNGFLRHIDRVLENDDYKQGKVLTTSGDYVSIMTLHGSKGLEFTFVFMAENSVNFKYDYKTVVCSPDGRIGYMLYDNKIAKKYNTFQREMIINEGKKDTLSEAMRLMYVGFTRAKQKLFINLKSNNDIISKSVFKYAKQYAFNDGNITDIASQADSFSAWIWFCLMKHSEFKEIAEHFGISMNNSENLFKEKIFEYEFCDKVMEQKIELQPEDKEEEPDNILYKKMSDIIYSDYDNSLSQIPSKLSVTQITKKFKENEQFDFKLKRPSFVIENGSMTGAERGTAIHTFFQYCDFAKAMENPVDEINNVMNRGYISSIQAESIVPEKITAFFESDLYKRIEKADKVWREHKFMVAVSELDINNNVMDKFKKSDGMIKGIIDLMFEEENKIIIVDYKSDKGVSEKHLAERYQMQIQIYKSAVELTTGKIVKEAYLYSIEKEKSIPISI